jgi:hypothetical protein
MASVGVDYEQKPLSIHRSRHDRRHSARCACRCLCQVESSGAARSRVVNIAMRSRKAERTADVVERARSRPLHLLLVAGVGVAGPILGWASGSGHYNATKRSLAVNGDSRAQKEHCAELKRISQRWPTTEPKLIARETPVTQRPTDMLADALASFKRGLTTDWVTGGFPRPSMATDVPGAGKSLLHPEWSRPEINSDRVP